jgi:hypothetical protein
MATHKGLQNGAKADHLRHPIPDLRFDHQEVKVALRPGGIPGMRAEQYHL